MSDLRLTDLDAEPGCELPALELFRATQGGRNHAVCGEPSRMGLPPELTDLRQALGVLCAVDQGQVHGTLAICPYSDEQVTLWGPVVASAARRRGIGSALLRETRSAIRDGGFQSLRVLVDERNRIGRAFWLAHGLSPWKRNLVFEHPLGLAPKEAVAGVSLARSEDLDEVARLLRQGFPDSSYCDVPLSQRERQGYRHYLFQESGAILAAATVRAQTARNWLNMLTVAPDARGAGRGERLLAGMLHLEAALGVRRMGLEVLADNPAAIRLYEKVGFRRAWSCTIMTGPL